MSNVKTRKQQTMVLVMGAVLTALVIILQFMGSFIHLGPFSISLVLVPIVLGAALCGVKISTWLGLVFGIIVLLSGDAAFFMSFNAAGTVITVLAKGMACGLAAGLVYKALEKRNRYVAVFAAAVICPLVNTGVFLLGCVLFLMDAVTQLSNGAPVVQYMFLGLVGGNFLFELGSNMILSPAIVRLLSIGKKVHNEE